MDLLDSLSYIDETVCTAPVFVCFLGFFGNRLVADGGCHLKISVDTHSHSTNSENTIASGQNLDRFLSKQAH